MPMWKEQDKIIAGVVRAGEVVVLLGKSRSVFKQAEQLNAKLIAQQCLCSSTFDLRSAAQPLLCNMKKPEGCFYS